MMATPSIIWNINDKVGDIKLTNQGLDLEFPVSTTYNAIRANEGRSTGKWYWEVKVNSISRSDTCGIGISKEGSTIDFGTGYGSGDYRVYRGNGDFYYPRISNKPTYSTDTIGVALNLDNGTIIFYKNGTSLGTAYTGLSGTYYPMIRLYSSGIITTNFGNEPFTYQIPSGYSPYQEVTINKKLFIVLNNEYYYAKLGVWNSLGQNPTVAQIIDNGMDSISNIDIFNFESIYGKNWEAYCWTDGEAFTSGKINAQPFNQVLIAKNSIQINGIESATFNWSSMGNPRIALSVDNGISYHAFKNNSWIDVTNDISNGMTSQEYSNLNWENFLLLKGESNTLKHAYYLSEGDVIDDILITANMIGYNKLANESDYSVSYDITTKTITYSIKKDGTYSVNYVDGST